MGLGAPYWDSKSRGLLSGLTRDTGPKEIVRAALESSAYQTYDLFKEMKKDGLSPRYIKVDGGMVNNNWFCQFLGDIVNLKIYRSHLNEATALGAAFMAGLKIGLFKSLNDIEKKWKVERIFKPQLNTSYRKLLINGWSKSITKTLIH